jgi:hypothetical protein
VRAANPLLQLLSETKDGQWFQILVALLSCIPGTTGLRARWLASHGIG